MSTTPSRRAAVAATLLFLCCFSTATSARAQFTEDYIAPDGTSILSTSMSVVRAKSGRLVTVRGGVFGFRNVTIPRRARIEGRGPNPMIWLVTGTMTIDGTLDCSGRDGSDVVTLNAANFAVSGGRGGPAGGDGGLGSPETAQSSPRGGNGNGPYDFGAFGGRGGARALGANLRSFGSGGGGGVFTTAGDPVFRALAQASGDGGAGQQSVGLVPGGRRGSSIFLDRHGDNDFYGVGYDVFRKRAVVGELPLLVGGSGGGGGGDRSDPTRFFVSDRRGGGGGGGGGCLVIYCLGKIVVSGRVLADGGNGGGGEDGGSSRMGGSGGGGSGGMIFLIARDEIVLHARGETLDRGDSDFCISADGGVGGHSGFGSVLYRDKYVHARPRPNAGGFGGLGLIQLMTRSGQNRDGTNTVLDDHITIVRGTRKLVGAEKQRFLAWRAWGPSGKRVDDAGRPIPATRGGDLRPSPVLLRL